MTDRGELRGLIRDNLSRLIPLLLAAVAAPIIALLADLPTWATSAAAAAALVSVVLIVTWPQPRSAWRADTAGGRAGCDPAHPRGGDGRHRLRCASRCRVSDVRSAAMLIFVDSSQEMAAGVPAPPGSGTKLAAATRSVRQHVIDNQFEQVGLASFGDPCGSEEPLRELVPIAFDRKEAIADELTGPSRPAIGTCLRREQRPFARAVRGGEVAASADRHRRSRWMGRGLPDLIENWRGRDVDLT